MSGGVIRIHLSLLRRRLRRVVSPPTARSSGDPEHPANRGRLCSKGAALGDTLGATGRLLHPQIDGRSASWDEALDRRRRDFQANHRRARAGRGGALRLRPVSDRGLLRRQQADEGLHRQRQYRHQFAALHGVIGRRPYARFRRGRRARLLRGYRGADLVVLVGSNTAWCHPVLYQRLVAAREKRAAPRSWRSIRGIRDLRHRRYSSAVRPGSDVAVFAGLLVHLAERGALRRGVDGEHSRRALPPRSRPHASHGAIACRMSPTSPTCRPPICARFYDCFAATERTVTCLLARHQPVRRPAPTRSMRSSIAIWRPAASAGPAWDRSR